jgi:[protein-PII] uridylyltransferase
VSEAARAIEWASERFWWRVERAARKGKSAASTKRTSAVLQPGITVVDDEVEIDVDAAGVDQSLVLRVAAAAAHARYPISRRALLTLSAIITDDGEEWQERTRHAMVSLLGAGSHLVDSVEALERYELFSRMVPECSQPPPAKRLPHLHRRPTPSADRCQCRRVRTHRVAS